MTTVDDADLNLTSDTKLVELSSKVQGICIINRNGDETGHIR